MDREADRRVTPSCTRKVPPAWHSPMHYSLHYRLPVEGGGDGRSEVTSERPFMAQLQTVSSGTTWHLGITVPILTHCTVPILTLPRHCSRTHSGQHKWLSCQSCDKRWQWRLTPWSPRSGLQSCSSQRWSRSGA